MDMDMDMAMCKCSLSRCVRGEKAGLWMAAHDLETGWKRLAGAFVGRVRICFAASVSWAASERFLRIVEPSYAAHDAAARYKKIGGLVVHSQAQRRRVCLAKSGELHWGTSIFVCKAFSHQHSPWSVTVEDVDWARLT